MAPRPWRHRVWSLCDEKRCRELEECTVLCRQCHLDVSIETGVFVRNAKLQPSDVADIRRRIASTAPADLAVEFGVSERTVRDVVARRTWRSVTDDGLVRAA